MSEPDATPHGDPEVPEVPVDPEVPESTGPSEATIRRAPKLGVFLVVGGVLGALVTLILTSLFPVDENVGFAALYGYFLVYGIPAGVLVGALIGLAFDRRSKRRARTVTVEHERID
ncbi:hypothetical protein [Protaetiibacter larvae]|uniref:Potassium transporter Trk n=1 Tax=Protaetiibacter larvae TaxID=2592654 RepID=A0A5C1Y6T3_9MICO|nr:hypothetical protein [Protaetiibacter larvae]QEO09148.1 hypothetical protein FLP23_03420 [Protaetiibacter larvae]